MQREPQEQTQMLKSAWSVKQTKTNKQKTQQVFWCRKNMRYVVQRSWNEDSQPIWDETTNTYAKKLTLYFILKQSNEFLKRQILWSRKIKLRRVWRMNCNIWGPGLTEDVYLSLAGIVKAKATACHWVWKFTSESTLHTSLWFSVWGWYPGFFPSAKHFQNEDSFGESAELIGKTSLRGASTRMKYFSIIDLNLCLHCYTHPSVSVILYSS